MAVHENSSAFSMLRWRHCAPAAWLVVLGVALSAAVFWGAYIWETRTIRDAFTTLADSRFHAIGSSLDATERLLEFADNAFMVGPPIDAADFPEYLRSLKTLFRADRYRHPELVALNWAPRVPLAERPAYERAVRSALDPAFQISVPAPSGDPAPAAQREECYPVCLHIAADSNRARLGRDMAADAAVWDVMKRARDSGAPVAAAPMKLSKDVEGRLGYRVFVPLYRGGDFGDVQSRRRDHAGFLCFDLEVGEIVDQALVDVQPVGIELGVCDDTEGITVPVSRHRSRLAEASQAAAGELDFPEGGGELESEWTKDFLGRKVLIRGRSTPAFWIGRTVWQPWVLLCGGLLLTLAAAGYQVNRALHAIAVEHAVARRTALLCKEIEQWRQAGRKPEQDSSMTEVEMLR